MAANRENAAVRRMRLFLRDRMSPESLRTRGRGDLTDDFQRLDRRKLVAMPETGPDGFISQMLAWFETGGGAPTFNLDEVIENSGERLVLCRVRVLFPSGQASELLQIFGFDDTVERLELVIAYDVEDVDRATAEFASIVRGTQTEQPGTWGEQRVLD
jgi:hypothetical protein